MQRCSWFGGTVARVAMRGTAAAALMAAAVGCKRPMESASPVAHAEHAGHAAEHAGTVAEHGGHAAEHAGTAAEHAGHAAEHAGHAADHAGTAAPAGSGAPAPEAAICGTVHVSEALAAKVRYPATLFVFAKSKPGGGPPNAVRRDTVAALPVPFCLTAKDSMVPGLAFSGKVYVTARIDFDGNAGGAPGDLEGTLEQPIEVGARDVKVTIDRVRP